MCYLTYLILALSIFCQKTGFGRGGLGKGIVRKTETGTWGKTGFGKVLDLDLSHVARRCGKDTFRWLALLILYKATVLSLDPPVFMGFLHLGTPGSPVFT